MCPEFATFADAIIREHRLERFHFGSQPAAKRIAAILFDICVTTRQNKALVKQVVEEGGFHGQGETRKFRFFPTKHDVCGHWI
jgi:hypothetical protein